VLFEYSLRVPRAVSTFF